MRYRLVVRDKKSSRSIVQVVEEEAKTSGDLGDQIQEYIRLYAQMNRDNLIPVTLPVIGPDGKVSGVLAKRPEGKSHYHCEVERVK